MGILDKIVDAASKASPVRPQGNEADGIKAKKDNVAQYMKAVTNAPDDVKATPPAANPDKLHPTSKFGSRPGEKRLDTANMSFKHGTTSVPKTGKALVHEGEAIIPAKENPMNHNWSDAIKAPKKAKKTLKEIRTRKAKDGSFIHEHHHHSSDHKMEEHTSSDMAAMQAHMANNAPNIQAAPDGDGDEGAGAGAGAAMPGM